MPGPLLDYSAEPLFPSLYVRLKAEMDKAQAEGKDVTDLRPWMTRAAEIYNELLKDI